MENSFIAQLDKLCQNNIPKVNESKTTSLAKKSNKFNPVTNIFKGNTWQQKLLENTRIITNVEECQQITKEITKSASKKDPAVVAVDCEGVNLGWNGNLTLLEIGTARGEAFIFDVQENPKLVADGGLKALLENEYVIKIFHDCRNDAANLYNQFNVLLQNAFDTQTAHSLIEFQKRNGQHFKLLYVSLNTLCATYNAPKNPMKDQFKHIYRENNDYWSRRPLTRDMILYAASDVLVLINEQLYIPMAKAIKPEFKSFYSKLCSRQITIRIRRAKKAETFNPAFLKEMVAQIERDIMRGNREIRYFSNINLPEITSIEQEIIPTLENIQIDAETKKKKSRKPKEKKESVTNKNNKTPANPSKSKTVDIGCQTLSTGDISYTKLYFAK